MKKIKKGQKIAWTVLICASGISILGSLYGMLPFLLETALSFALLAVWAFFLILLDLRFFAKRQMLNFHTASTGILYTILPVMAVFIARERLAWDPLSSLTFIVVVHFALSVAVGFMGLHILMVGVCPDPRAKLRGLLKPRKGR